MNEILHANIFFFITGVAVIIFTALLCVALFHGIKVLRSLRRIIDRIEAGTEVIAEDIDNIRAYFSEEGFISRLIQTIMGTSRKNSTRERSRSRSKRNDLAINDEI